MPTKTKFFSASLILVILAAHIQISSVYAATASNYTNNGAATTTAKASATNIPVLDVTIPDAWNNSSFTADIEQKAGSATYWQGDTLNAIPVLGSAGGVGYKEDGTAGFQGTEAVVIDLDNDGAYTSAADSLVDADGSATAGAGTDTTPIGTSLLPMTAGIADGKKSVCVDSLTSPTAVRIDTDGNCGNAGGTEGTYVLGSSANGALRTEVNSTWAFYDANDDGNYDIGEVIYKVQLATKLRAGSTLLDADGSTTSGAGTSSAAVGTTLTAMGEDIATGGNALCVNSLSSPTVLRIDTNGDCVSGTSKEGTYLLGTNASTAGLEVTGKFAFVDSNSNGTYDNGEDIFIQSIAGTYSGAGDTNVYGTAGLSNGDALTSFASDCDSAGAGTQACKFTGSSPIDSTESILVDQGTKGGAAPNSVVDKQADQLLGLGVQNAGTAVDTTDISAVKVWVENGSTTGFQSGEDTLLGTMTVNSTNSKEWRLGSLTQAIPANGKRIYITANIAASPTDTRTLNFRIPTLNDAGSDGVVTANNDRGIFVSSNNDGPTDSAVTNANTQTIDTTAPTFTTQYYSDSGLTTSLGSNPRLKAGTYYLKITANEALSAAPTVTINAEGTANDVSNASTSSVSGNIYKYTRTISSSASAVGSVLEDISITGTDSAGNASTSVDPTNESTTAAYTDTTAPTITLSTSASNPTNTSPFSVTATFSETASGFIVSDLTVGNGTAGNFSAVSGTVFTFDITPSGQGAVTVDITSGAAQDLARNNNTAATQLSRTFDSARPTIALTSTVANTTTANSPDTVTATFNEAVTGFTIDDITVGNGSAGNFTAVSSTVYTFDVTPTMNGTVTVDVASGKATDSASNTNTAATQLSFIFDSPRPTIAITSTATSPTRTSPIPIAVAFSKTVADFVSGDIVVGNGSVTGSSFAGSGTGYTFTVTPSGQGEVTVDIPEGVATNNGNNNFAAAQFNITYDSTAPTFTVQYYSDSNLTTSLGNNPHLKAGTYYLKISAGESVASAPHISIDAEGSNNDVSNASTTLVSGNDYKYTRTITSDASAIGSVLENISITATDTAGNTATNADPTNEATKAAYTDTISPTVTIQYYSDSNLTTSLGNNPRLKAGTYYLKVTGSETLTGSLTININAEGSNNDVSNGSVAAVSGNDYKYTRTITSDTSAIGSVLEDIGVTVTDSAGNIASDTDPTNESTKVAYTDTTSPTFTTQYYSDSSLSTSLGDNPILKAGTYYLKITANEALGSAPTVSIAAEGTANDVSNASTSSVSGNVYKYTRTITSDAAAVGSVIEDVSVTGTDAASNTSTNANPTNESTAAAYTDTTRPTVSLSTTASNPTNSSSFTVTATFSETVTGFAIGDLTIGNGSASSFNAVSGTVYTFTVTASDQGAVTVDVSSGVAQDSAGNTNTAATQLSRTYDTDAPTFTIQYYSDSGLTTSLGDNPSLKAGTYYMKITGGETLASAPTISIAAEGTANDVSSAATTSVSGNIYKYTRTITSDASAVGTTLEDISIAGTDSAGNAASNANPSNESSKAAYTDTTAPTVTLTSTADSPTGTSPIPMTATFSETVTGFAVGDITVTRGSAGSVTAVSSTVYTFNVTPSSNGVVKVDIDAGGAQDTAGNTNTAATQFSISYNGGSISISGTTATPTGAGATVAWTTNSAATSQVQYGPTTTYGARTTLDSASVTSHSVSVTGLLPCAYYHYRVISTASSVTATGSDLNFTTSGCTGSAGVENQTGSTIDHTTSNGLSLDSTTGISLTVPSGATTQDVVIQVKRLNGSSVRSVAGNPSGHSHAGGTYNLLALSDATTKVSTFTEPITVTLHYTSDDIAGLVESSLWIYRYDSDWTALDNCTVDTTAKTVTCTTTHFSDFSIFGTATSSSTTTTSNTGTSGNGGHHGHGTDQSAAVRSYVQSHTTTGNGSGALKVTINGQQLIFIDVPITAWFSSYVNELALRNVVSGYATADGSLTRFFRPQKNITYAEIAKMTVLAAGADVSNDIMPRNRSARQLWAAKYVAQAEKMHLSIFKAGLNVKGLASRGEVIQTILEALQIPLDGTQNPYTDLSANNPHYSAILTATKLGILNGDADASGTSFGTIRPNAPINRAEVAKMLILALKIAAKEVK